MNRWQWCIGAGLLGAAVGSIMIGLKLPVELLGIVAVVLFIGGLTVVDDRIETALWSVGVAALMLNIAAHLASDTVSWLLAAVVALAAGAAATQADPDDSTIIAITRGAGIIGLIFAFVLFKQIV